MKKIDERCFQHVFILTQHHKEIRNHPKWVSDVKPFTELYVWDGIKYPAVKIIIMLNLKEEILNVWVLMKKVFIAGYFISKFPTICILEKRFWKIYCVAKKMCYV